MAHPEHIQFGRPDARKETTLTPEQIIAEQNRREARALFSNEKTWFIHRGDSGDYLIEPMSLKDIHFAKKMKELYDPQSITEAEIKDLLINPDEERHVLFPENLRAILKELDNLRAQEALKDIH